MAIIMNRKRGWIAIAVAAMLIASMIFPACGEKTYTVSFDSKGGTTVSAITVAEGETISELPVIMRDGYDFVGWSTSASGGNTIGSITPTEDTKLYAVWTEKGSQIQYSVVLNALDGKFKDERSIKTVKLIDGSLLPEIENPEREGYAFVGWFKDETLTEEWNVASDKVVEDVGLYAKYKLIAEEHDVEFRLNYEGASDVTRSTESGRINFVPEREGYEFRGWWYSSGVNGEGETVLTRQYNMNMPVTSDDLILYADWVEERESPLQLEAPVLTLTQDPDNYRNLECSWTKVIVASSYHVTVRGGGNEDPVMDRDISATSFNFERSWGAGSYTVTVKANGDGINNVNSSVVSRSCSYMSLGAVTGAKFDMDSNILTWYEVANAEKYAVYVGNEVIAEDLTVTKCDLSVLQAGNNTVRITATAENYGAASASVSLRKLRLATPKVTIETNPETNDIHLSWSRSLNADTYIIKLDNKEIETEETEYVLSKTNSAWGQKTSLKFSVNAFDSKANYLISTGAKEYGLGGLHKLTVNGISSSYGQTVSLDTYKPYAFTVTFERNGGSITTSLISQTVTATKELVIPSVTRNGYVFRGWFADEACKNIYEFPEEITEDVTLYAGWQDITVSSSRNVDIFDISAQYNSTSSVYGRDTYNTTANSPNYAYFTAPKTGTYTLHYSNYNSNTSSYYNMYLYIANITKNSTIYSNNYISATSSLTNFGSLTFNANAGDVIRIRTYRYSTNSSSYYSTFRMYVEGGELPERQEIYAKKASYLETVMDKQVSSNTVYTVMTGSKIKLAIGNSNVYNRFAGWYAGNELISENPVCEYVMPNKDVTITAKFN